MTQAPRIDPALRTPGRAACSNDAGRFERHARQPDAAGDPAGAGRTLLRTEARAERPRRAITYNRSPDLPFDRSVNPYRGCEHGCIYCFARPTHAWLGLSAGLDFETRLIARPGIADTLRRELAAPGYRVAPIAIGTNTDPYQPVEEAWRVTRACLEVLEYARHPVAIVTKGALVERDLDILSRMAARGLARVGISLTTLDAGLARRLEPRAPGPARRLATIRALAQAGVPVRAMTSPVIPGLTDHEVEALLYAARDAGAAAASWIMLRLPREVAPLFREWLAEHCPDRAGRVMGLVRDMHGSKDYDARWGRRMRGQGPHAEMIAQRFRVAARRLGLDAPQPALRCDLFRPPPRDPDQPDLFATCGG
ncbi:PA0069 family radical SAM protein [Roseovarius salinarum]|uniref:PA0069 family radical SAM protein n=1 Tax=Roseovarius salinarum TaxID=1981892 RepID=UPI000C3221ED|nr:PA0069 family radical SAM protein [Roseovarius salinarum]